MWDCFLDLEERSIELIVLLIGINLRTFIELCQPNAYLILIRSLFREVALVQQVRRLIICV
jgi:hypothetical protein